VTAAADSHPIIEKHGTPAPLIIAGLAFLVAFSQPMATLARDWWSDPDAGHGLLLFPIALWMAWKSGLMKERSPQPRLGMTLLIGACVLRYLSGLAAELFTMRVSFLGAIIGLIVYAYGVRQVLRWWLPFLLVFLSIPLPEVLLGSLALPLQLTASKWGATLLEARHVPVRLAGNVIRLPGRSLFVTEACSGLRSLTSLLALGLLIGGLWLRKPWSRVLLVAAALPVAMALNAVRIFLTGFFVYYVDPALAEGLMHYTQGWAIFVVAFLILSGFAFALTRIEAMFPRRTA
jgi:exosortase